MSSLPPVRSGPSADDAGGAFTLGAHGAIPSAARWRGRAELRADLRSALALTGGLLLAGVPAGLLWWWLAPRADYRITSDGLVAVGQPPRELAVGDDSVLVLVLGGLGLLAGGLAWAVLRRRRGGAVAIALAAGAALAAVVAWQLGELLGPGPTAAELAHVGGVVTLPLRLAAVPALAVAPFSAVLAYLVGALVAREDDLGRTGAPPGVLPGAGEPATGEEPVDAGAR